MRRRWEGRGGRSCTYKLQIHAPQYFQLQVQLQGDSQFPDAPGVEDQVEYFARTSRWQPESSRSRGGPDAVFRWVDGIILEGV